MIHVFVVRVKKTKQQKKLPETQAAETLEKNFRDERTFALLHVEVLCYNGLNYKGLHEKPTGLT